MRRTRIGVLLLLALLVPAGRAHAQEPAPALPFGDIPDIVQYLSYHISQCDECTTDGTPFLTVPSESDAPPLPSAGDWLRDIVLPVPWGEISFPVLDPGNGLRMIFAWLVFHVTRLFIWLVCMLFLFGQQIVNAMLELINAVLWTLNMSWRLAIFAWLNVRVWLWDMWTWFNTVIAGFEQLQWFLAWLWAWAQALWDVLLTVLVLFGQLVGLLLGVIMSILGFIAWIVGLTVNVIMSILGAIQGTTLPAQLEGETHGVYYMVRGMLDALHDSQIGWVMNILYALAYIGFFAWIARYMSAAREG